MRSLELPKAPDDARELVELENSATELLAELDEEMKENKRLRDLSSLVLSAWDDTDAKANVSPDEKKSDAVQHPPK